MRQRAIVIVAGALVAGLAAAQAAAPPRTNPAIDPSLRLEARAALPMAVAAMMRRACYDCHSNETHWPWYAHVPPTAWLVGRDVARGRGQMNFSRWGEYSPFDRADMLDTACKLTRRGEMPLRPYLLLHADARLGPQDIHALCDWTRREAARLTSGASE